MEKSIDMSSYFFIGGTVFIIWHWKWQEEDCSSDEEDRTTLNVIPETPTISDSENSDDDGSTTDLMASLSLLTGGDTIITHTVTFKCIGSTEEAQYQEVLSCAAARLNRGEVVPCQVLPEPSNPVDSEAICIQFKLDRWYCVGYIILEALPELHVALRGKKVTKVSINWIKYIIYWRTPGWYTGINITTIGEWSSTIVRSQSANLCTK